MIINRVARAELYSLMFPSEAKLGQIHQSAGARFAWCGVAWERLDTEVLHTVKVSYPPRKPPQHDAQVIRWRAQLRKLKRLTP